jgi:hypothetical protein
MESNNNDYSPDKWVIVELKYENDTVYKILASWYGGFGGSDQWRLSSGAVQVTEYDNHYEILNESGSVYYCYKNAEGFSVYSSGIYERFEKSVLEDNSYKISRITIKELETALLK